jgi:arylsulfatase
MAHPNIVMVSLDSVRADHLSMYGYDRETTPYIAEVAEEGLTFKNSYIPGVGTPTSFGGTFTGSYINAVQSNYQASHWQQALDGRNLLPEMLQDAGYHTGAIHANARLSEEYGWDQGWDVFGAYRWAEEASNEGSARTWWSNIKKDVLLPAVQRTGFAGQIITARNILLKQDAYTPWEELWSDIEAFVRDAPEPWFLWVLLVDTHHPWHPPKEYQEWDQPGFRVSHFWNWEMRYHPDLAGERRSSIVNAYDNELRHADAFVEQLDQLLADTDNADVPFFIHSDHGDDLGEHGRYGHAPEMYDTVVRVPLIARNVGKTGVIERPITHLDLPNTILNVAGSDRSIGDGYQLFGDETREGPIVIENMTSDGNMMAAATDGEWKVLVHPERGWEAYHRPNDRFEQNDRFGDHPKELEEAVREHRDERLSNHPDRDNVETDDDGEDDIRNVREELANLGYLE